MAQLDNSSGQRKETNPARHLPRASTMAYFSFQGLTPSFFP
jgi:hypothetical protein